MFNIGKFSAKLNQSLIFQPDLWLGLVNLSKAVSFLSFVNIVLDKHQPFNNT